ncbi:MAG TPA: hypothetical protein VGD89_13990 [Flavipsychrobacter sp.]
MNELQKRLEVLEEEKQRLEAVVLEAMRNLKDIRKQISNIRGDKVNWDDVAVRYLKQRNELLTSIQILENTQMIQEELSNPIARKEHMKDLSLRLNRLVKKGVLFKREERGVKGNYYGLAEWIVSGNLRPEYEQKLLINISAISGNNRSF